MREQALGAGVEGVKTEAAANWWEGFARAVEDPRTSTYDYLKNSILRGIEAEQANGVGEVLTQAQKKAVKELLALTDPKELRATLKPFEQNRLLFDDKTRIGLQCFGALLDAFVSAREQYNEELEKRAAKGLKAPSDWQQQRDLERIVEQKLAEPELAEKIGEMAQAVTGKDAADVQQTVSEATRQLRQPFSLARFSRDLYGISQKYFTLDNAINVGVCALPLITWQYRWALAAVFGAYVARKAVGHTYRAGLSLWGGDRVAARENGGKALTALKAAGGNALAIGISPLVGQLPKYIAGFAAFGASFLYNTSIEVMQHILAQKEKLAEAGVREGVQGWGKRLFHRYKDVLVIIAAGAVKEKAPGELTQTFADASKRLPVSMVGRAATNAWSVGKAMTRRFNYLAQELAHGHDVVFSAVHTDFRRAAEGITAEAEVPENDVKMVMPKVAPDQNVSLPGLAA